MIEDIIQRHHNYEREGRINKALLRIAKMHANPEYSCKILQRANSTLTYEANRHSFMLEPEVKEQTHYETQERLLEAWKFGTDEYVDGAMDADYLLELNRRIDPTHSLTNTFSYAGRGYRKDNVNVTGKDSVRPVKAQKVEEEMYDLLEYLNNEGLNPVTRAVNSHLHVARIHPFYEGNGRTSRMLMNIILQKNGLPAVTIRESERSTYLGILQNAMRSYNTRNQSKGERNYGGEILFMDYHLDKMDQYLDTLEENLKGQRTYIVSMEKMQKPQIMGAKHEILNILRSRGQGTARFRDNKLHVTGDISCDTICTIMNNSVGRKGRYEVKVKN